MQDRYIEYFLCEYTINYDITIGGIEMNHNTTDVIEVMVKVPYGTSHIDMCILAYQYAGELIKEKYDVAGYVLNGIDEIKILQCYHESRFKENKK